MASLIVTSSPKFLRVFLLFNFALLVSSKARPFDPQNNWVGEFGIPPPRTENDHEHVNHINRIPPLGHQTFELVGGGGPGPGIIGVKPSEADDDQESSTTQFSTLPPGVLATGILSGIATGIHGIMSNVKTGNVDGIVKSTFNFLPPIHRPTANFVFNGLMGYTSARPKLNNNHLLIGPGPDGAGGDEDDEAEAQRPKSRRRPRPTKYPDTSNSQSSTTDSNFVEVDDEEDHLSVGLDSDLFRRN